MHASLRLVLNSMNTPENQTNMDMDKKEDNPSESVIGMQNRQWITG